MSKKMKSIEELLEDALVPEEEQPYQVPENWVWVRLLNGYATCLDKYRKPINATERAARAGNIPYYGATGQVGWIDNYLTDEQLVILGEDGAPFLDPYKKKAYMIEGKAWVNNHAHILKSHFDSVGNKFLLNYLNQFNFYGYVSGSTRLKLTQSQMQKIPIPLPPLNELKRITAKVERLLRKIDEAQQLIEEAKETFELRRVVILDKAFRGELTRKWRKENQKELETELEAYREDELYPLPSNWKWVDLNTVCEKITDGTHHSPKSYPVGDYMYITAKNIKKHGIVLDNVTYVSKEVHEEIYKRCDVRKGDVLYIKDGATTGIATVNNISEEFSLLSSVALLRPKKDVLLSEYLTFCLNAPSTKRRMLGMMSGNAITRLTLKKIKQGMIPLPSLDEQKMIVSILEKVNTIDKQIDHYSSVEDNLMNLKQSILFKAFRGELGTNDPSEVSAIDLLKEEVLQEQVK